MIAIHYFETEGTKYKTHLLTFSDGKNGKLVILQQTVLGISIINEPIAKYIEIIHQNELLKDIDFRTYVHDITLAVDDFSNLSMLQKATKSFADIIVGRANMVLNLDYMIRIINQGGFGVIYTSYASGEERAKQVLDQIQKYQHPNKEEMKVVLLSLHHPETSEINLNEASLISKGIEDIFGKNPELHYSYIANSTIGENIGLTVIAA